MKNKFLKIVGITPEKRYCLSGVYQLFETKGIPLENICDWCWKNNYVPAWDYFFDDAIKAGLTKEKIKLRITQAFEYTSDFNDDFILEDAMAQLQKFIRN